MAEIKLDDKIFIKQCLDEYGYHIYNNMIPNSILRRIPGAAMKGEELKELSVIVRSNMSNASLNMYKLCNAYKNRFKQKATIKEIMSDSAAEYSKSYHQDSTYAIYMADPLSKVVSNVNATLRTINNQIEFIRSSYKVSDSNDERFNKANVKSIFKEDSMVSFDSGWDELERIEADLNQKKIDPYSPEYGKLIIKRLNSFKADFISAFNKYFGKNSVFAEFNLSDMIR